MIGIALPWKKLVERRHDVRSFGVGAIGVCAWLYLYFGLNYFLFVHDFWNYAQYLLGSILCSFAMLLLFSGRKLPLLSVFGKASLNIFMLHWFVIMLTKPHLIALATALARWWCEPTNEALYYSYIEMALQLVVIFITCWFLSRSVVSERISAFVALTYNALVSCRVRLLS